MGELDKQTGSTPERVTTATPDQAEHTPALDVKPGRRASEDVIINAPMSFAGAFQRTMRLRRKGGINQKPWYAHARSMTPREALLHGIPYHRTLFGAPRHARP